MMPMTPPPTRPTVLLAAGLAIALAGCGKPPEATKADPAKAPPGPTAGPAAPPAPAGPAGPTDASSVAAEKFAQSLVAGAADPNKLSVPFLKAVGLPVLAAEDKAKGYSLSAAQLWLNRAGAELGKLGPLGLPTGFTAGGTAVFVSPVGAGRYSLRMVQADGAWKVDWFGVGTAKANDVEKPKTADEAFQDFAVLAFLDAISGTATPRDDRVPLAAAVLSAGTREKWAAPFPADKDQGLGYNQAKLGQIMDGFGGGATAVTRTRTGADSFKVEITKDGATRAFAAKLVRTPAGEWVIDEFKGE
jgi:hypothetical protein